MTARVPVCSSCKAPILWVTMVPSSARMPLDPPAVDPETSGAIFRVGQFGYAVPDLRERLAALPLKADDPWAKPVESDYTAHVSHFASCSNARGHRR